MLIADDVHRQFETEVATMVLMLPKLSHGAYSGT